MASGIIEPSSRGSEDSRGTQPQGEQHTPGTKHSKLVQKLLTASSSLPTFLNDLLTTQAVVVAGTEAAGFIVERSNAGVGLRSVAHIRPDNSNAETRAAALSAFQEIIKPCITQGKDGAIEISSGDGHPESQFCLVTLLRSEGDVIAASAVITRCRNIERAQQRLVSMQLVAGYFELYTLKRNSEQAQIVAQSHQHVLQLATAVATAHGFESAAMNLCNELATRTGAARVTLGWMKGDKVKVVAFSHTEEFDKKQELVVQLCKVMEECVDQEEPVFFDPSGGSSQNVTRASEHLSRMEGGNSVLCLPLRRRDEVVGVAVMEFAPGVKLTPNTSAGLSVAIDLLAPQLYDRYQNDRWLITKTGISIREMSKHVIGSQYMLAKLISVAVIAVIVFVCKFRMMYHVSAPFQFASVDQTTIACPFDGQVNYVPGIYPGVHVKKGQVLLTIDAIEYEKKLFSANADAAKYDAQARDALSQNPPKTGDYAVAMASELGAKAEAALYQFYIDEATIRAPSNGLILTGDFEDQDNVMKRQGDELFTFQPDGKKRLEIFVNEADIQLVKEWGKVAEFATTALPRNKYPCTITRINPQGDSRDNDNVFRVFADVPNWQQHPEWLPGMEGQANIDIGQRRLIWIWTHKFVDYVQMKMWTWF
ncbi:MAG TPA: HlyD family efflux transporter periplasmic adaptor subunit [Tepidisphaeraceae bacterium]|nr:HlyD family efflux transporter periplasmic adaptor subunit [Tepidisphaeraceae bacterium]